MSPLPLDDARCNRVKWVLSLAVTSVPGVPDQYLHNFSLLVGFSPTETFVPFSNNSCIYLGHREDDARCKGVLQFPSSVLTSAPCPINSCNRTWSPVLEQANGFRNPFGARHLYREITSLLAIVGSGEDSELLKTCLLELQSEYRTSRRSTHSTNSSRHAWLLLSAHLRVVAPSDNRTSSLARQGLQRGADLTRRQQRNRGAQQEPYPKVLESKVVQKTKFHP